MVLPDSEGRTVVVAGSARVAVPDVELVSDVELVHLARLGDMAAFAGLVGRHQAALRATAIGLLGYTDDAEDAVQDALVVALQRLPELRDAGAVGPWLKAIVRNNCRALLRARRVVPVPELEPWLAADTFGPEQRLDRLATGDWIHHALASLSPPLREVMMLRYFSDVSSYREISRICGIPVETVGSRLRDGRRALQRQLTQSTEETHDAASARAKAWHRESEQIAESMLDGTFGQVLDDWYHPDALIEVMGIMNGERSLLLNMLDWTFSADVGVRLHNTMASPDVLLWEADFLNPPSDPEHCPPTMAALFTLDQGRVARMRITYGTHHPADA